MKSIQPPALGLRRLGAKAAGKVAKVAVKHWMDYKGPAKIHSGKGNSIGRSGTSYKPYR